MLGGHRRAVCAGISHPRPHASREADGGLTDARVRSDRAPILWLRKLRLQVVVQEAAWRPAVPIVRGPVQLSLPLVSVDSAAEG